MQSQYMRQKNLDLTFAVFITKYSVMFLHFLLQIALFSQDILQHPTHSIHRTRLQAWIFFGPVNVHCQKGTTNGNRYQELHFAKASHLLQMTEPVLLLGF